MDDCRKGDGGGEKGIGGEETTVDSVAVFCSTRKVIKKVERMTKGCCVTTVCCISRVRISIAQRSGSVPDRYLIGRPRQRS